jgi:hypothetical protein
MAAAGGDKPSFCRVLDRGYHVGHQLTVASLAPYRYEPTSHTKAYVFPFARPCAICARRLECSQRSRIAEADSSQTFPLSLPVPILPPPRFDRISLAAFAFYSIDAAVLGVITIFSTCLSAIAFFAEPETALTLVIS